MLASRKLILVLGAHRSGTSLCSAALQSLGAELCLPSQYSNDENRKGFFEHPDIVDFNDELLAHLGGVWDNPMFDGPESIATAELSDWHARASNLFTTIYGDRPVVALKDPRLCQLLDFWLPVFADLGYTDDEIFAVHVLRTPVEVAVSQQRRVQATPEFYEVGSELAEGAALWLALTAQSLSTPMGRNSLFVHYESLLRSAEATVRDLANFVGLPADQEVIGRFCREFVDEGLYRSAANEAQDAQLRTSIPQALEFYDTLSGNLVDGRVDEAVVGSLRAIYDRPDTRELLGRTSSHALSRLSQRSRRESLELRRSEEVIADLTTQNTEYSGVIAPLREQLESLENGIGELRKQRDAERMDKERLVREMTDEIDSATAVIEEKQGVIEEMEGSHSWRVTAPLRDLRTWQIETLRSLKHFAATFHVRSIYTYNRLSVTHPRFAWFSRRALRPVFRVVKRFSRGAEYQRSREYDSGLLMPMIYQQWESSGSYQPLVSVIVPNYNHAEYLRLRLSSIYSQSYRNIEVILLDDASGDDSAEILREFCALYPERTRLVVNEHNSGGVFNQWEKGLQMARGEIVWIAESDDWCTENMLETLVPFFENEAMQLAYTRTVFMDGDGEQERWSINEYLHDIDPDQWQHANIQTAYNAVTHAFAYKNIIPNVSSAIFRNPGKLELLQDPQWKGMRICGDWIFYLHLLRGGLIAYSPDACNYYRLHGSNTSVTSYSEDKYYQEHEAVAKTVLEYFDAAPAVFEQQRDNLVAHWRETRDDFSESAFDACYSLARIEAARQGRAPNLLMTSYAFCAGGGETFPVELANLMKGQGYNVTYLDCGREPRNEGVRRRLRADIPVVSDFTQLERIVKDFGIDVVHSHHAWVDSTVLEVLPEDAPCKTVVTLHGMYETIHDYDLAGILPRLVERSALLIYVAEKNLSALRKHKLLDAANVVCIENALSDDPFDIVSRESLGIPADAFVLALVSRAMEEKGWQEAIEIVGTAQAACERDLHLVMVGDGDEHDRLSRLDLPDNIHLVGYQQNVRGFFAMADVGFLPSRFLGESAPLVIIECLQAGRPFLASELGEIPQMLQGPGGTAGLLVPLNGIRIDTDSWARQIAALASSDEELHALAARVEGAAAKFDPQLMAASHDAAYRSVLQPAPAGVAVAQSV